MRNTYIRFFTKYRYGHTYHSAPQYSAIEQDPPKLSRELLEPEASCCCWHSIGEDARNNPKLRDYRATYIPLKRSFMRMLFDFLWATVYKRTYPRKETYSRHLLPIDRNRCNHLALEKVHFSKKHKTKLVQTQITFVKVHLTNIPVSRHSASALVNRFCYVEMNKAKLTR